VHTGGTIQESGNMKLTSAGLDEDASFNIFMDKTVDQSSRPNLGISQKAKVTGLAEFFYQVLAYGKKV
jgi:hypothetical protein